MFEYVPEGWGYSRRSDDVRGWNVPSIVTTEARKWDDFAACLRDTRPLGIVHEAPQVIGNDLLTHNTVLSYGYVLGRAALGRNRLAVLDWGGGLGHFVLFARALFPELAMQFTVKEVPGICAEGQRRLPEVRFVTTDEAYRGESFDLVMASGALQYCEDWEEVVRCWLASARGFIYVTRLPYVDRSPSYVMLQRPQVFGYDTTYLSWVFNRSEFVERMTHLGARLEREFLVGEELEVPRAPEPRVKFMGFLFRTGSRN
jgi:putative methyltransferase (TIGR04325 family)